MKVAVNSQVTRTREHPTRKYQVRGPIRKSRIGPLDCLSLIFHGDGTSAIGGDRSHPPDSGRASGWRLSSLVGDLGSRFAHALTYLVTHALSPESGWAVDGDGFWSVGAWGWRIGWNGGHAETREWTYRRASAPSAYGIPKDRPPK